MKIVTLVVLWILATNLGSAQTVGLKWKCADNSNSTVESSSNWRKSLFLAKEMPASVVAMPSAWCYKELAFFCKLEVKMEAKAKFPIKFRLGDVRYVDQLEGKISSYSY